jgi:hypothetical protein
LTRETAAVSHKIKISFTRRAAASLSEIAIPLYKFGGRSIREKFEIPYSREVAAPLGKIAIPLYKRGGCSLT